jgi:hypothetical protein
MAAMGRIEPFADNSMPPSVIAGADELIESGSLSTDAYRFARPATARHAPARIPAPAAIQAFADKGMARGGPGRVVLVIATAGALCR